MVSITPSERWHISRRLQELLDVCEAETSKRGLDHSAERSENIASALGADAGL